MAAFPKDLYFEILLYIYLQVLSEKNIQFSGFFIAEKVNKDSNNTPVAKNIISLCVRRFSNGIIPWLGVKVMSDEW